MKHLDLAPGEKLVPVSMSEPIEGVEIFEVVCEPANDATVAEFELDHLLCTYVCEKEPCWGEVRDWKERRGYDTGSVVASILTCEGHSMVPHNGVYHTLEDLLRARKTGGHLYATFKHGPRFPGESTPNAELASLWATTQEDESIPPDPMPRKKVKIRMEDLLAEDNDCP